MDNFKKQEKKSEITEDELKQVEKDLQKLTDESGRALDDLLAKKEKELRAVEHRSVRPGRSAGLPVQCAPIGGVTSSVSLASP